MKRYSFIGSKSKKFARLHTSTLNFGIPKGFQILESKFPESQLILLHREYPKIKFRHGTHIS